MTPVFPPVYCPTALPTWLRCCSDAVLLEIIIDLPFGFPINNIISLLLLVSTKSLRLRHPTSTVPFPRLVQLEQKSRITTRLRCGLSLPAWFFRHILMSHASLGMQQQLFCQYCHGQCAFLTCMCFREDKQSTCCWQVPSVLVGLDAQSFHVVQFTFRPLNECRWEAEDSHTCACEQFRC